MRHLASFVFAFVVLSLLWLIFEVPFSIYYWFQDRWYFARDLWNNTDSSRGGER